MTQASFAHKRNVWNLPLVSRTRVKHQAEGSRHLLWAKPRKPLFAPPFAFCCSLPVVDLLDAINRFLPSQWTNTLERVTEKGPVKLVVRVVTPREPRLSDVVEMDVEVTAQPDVEIKPPEFGQAVGDFLVRDYSERKDPIDVLDRAKRTFDGSGINSNPFTPDAI